MINLKLLVYILYRVSGLKVTMPSQQLTIEGQMPPGISLAKQSAKECQTDLGYNVEFYR